jgi:hypothetical protein
MSKVILTVTKYNVNIQWEQLLNITYGTKLNHIQLNAKAFGPYGEVNGSFNYFDQNKKKIKINDILNVGQHKISVIFSPTDLKNYESTTFITRYLIVLPSNKKLDNKSNKKLDKKTIIESNHSYDNSKNKISNNISTKIISSNNSNSSSSNIVNINIGINVNR